MIFNLRKLRENNQEDKKRPIWLSSQRKVVIKLESKQHRAREEKKTMSKAQEVHYFSDFKAADRAMERTKRNR